MEGRDRRRGAALGCTSGSLGTASASCSRPAVSRTALAAAEAAAEAADTEGAEEPLEAAEEEAAASEAKAPSESSSTSMLKREKALRRRRAEGCRNRCFCGGFISQVRPYFVKSDPNSKPNRANYQDVSKRRLCCRYSMSVRNFLGATLWKYTLKHLPSPMLVTEWLENGAFVLRYKAEKLCFNLWR